VGGVADKYDAAAAHLVCDEAAEAQDVPLEYGAFVEGGAGDACLQGLPQLRFGVGLGVGVRVALRWTPGLRWLISAKPLGELL
jgi:hypothetical protein